MEKEKIEWKTTGDDKDPPDDFVSYFEDYVLRVEQMDNDYWWWAVYKGKIVIAFDWPCVETEKEAKQLAEKAFNKYRYAKSC